MKIQDIYGNNTGSGTNAIALTVFKTPTCNGSVGTTMAGTADASGYLNTAGSLQTTTTAASSGTATFASVVYTTASTQTAETIYYGASTAGLTVACSTGFANTNIVPATATKLVYTTQPATKRVDRGRIGLHHAAGDSDPRHLQQPTHGRHDERDGDGLQDFEL